MRKLLEFLLLPLASAVLKKYRPLVIAVAGTVGKTSTKNAIAAALEKTRAVRASEKSNNTEIGCAVTVIGASAQGRSVFGWGSVLAKGIGLLFATSRAYPEILVLEFGEQHPGDLERLVRRFPPTIGVITTIGATHAEMLGGIEGVVREMATLAQALPWSGALVLNADDSRVSVLASKTEARTITYGFYSGARVRGLDPHPSVRRDDKQGLFVEGMLFKIEVDGNVIPAVVPHVLGNPSVSAALAAVAVGIALEENPLTLAEGLRLFRPEKGRLRLLEGVRFTTLLDDTYNASTVSMIEALRALRSLPLDEGEERIAVLGDMREMGAHSEEEHRKVGAAVTEFGVDRLVTVGEMSRDIGRGARGGGLSEEKTTHFSTTEEAGKFVQSIAERGDLVLVKGSRGMHMESIVKELMAEPLKAEELLEWGEPKT